MPMPSLSELMQYVQNSQQNAFIPKFMESQQYAQDRAYKQQQMDKIMQEMEMAKLMAPLERSNKEALTSQALAQAGSVNEATRQSAAIGTPENLLARAEQPGLQNLQTDQQITDLQHKNSESSIKYNELLDLQVFKNNFQQAKNDTDRIELAKTRPDLFMKLFEMQNDLRGRQVSAQASAGNTFKADQAILQMLNADPDFAKKTPQEKASAYADALARKSASSWGAATNLSIGPQGPVKEVTKAPQTSGTSTGELSPEQRAKLIQMLQGQ